MSNDRRAPQTTPERIVSLVPSLTETCFDVGLGERVVGVTDWCVHPADGVAALPKVGGTKDADVAAIEALKPDLVIANHEENTRRVVEELEQRGLRVWLTYPRTLEEGTRVLHELAALSPDRDLARAVAFAAERALGFLDEPDTTSSRPRGENMSKLMGSSRPSTSKAAPQALIAIDWTADESTLQHSTCDDVLSYF